MRICVIVTTYDLPDYLDLVLHGYRVQDDKNFEIIVADDGSDAQTKSVVDCHAAEMPVPLHHVWQEDRGFRKTVILNKAIAATDAEYLIFTDGDLIPRSDFVSSHRAMAEPGFYVVGAYNRLPQKTTERITPEIVTNQKVFSPLWLATNGYLPSRGFLRFFLPKPLARYMDRYGKAGYGRFPGGNSACYRADALAVGGFCEAMTYGVEDREFGTRLCNYGLRNKRLKNATFLLHLEHERPYWSIEEMERNKQILRETEISRRAKLDGTG